MNLSSEILAEKKYPSVMETVPEIQNFVMKKISPFISKEKIDAVTLAVSEAVSNAIKHGNKSDAEKNIEIKIRLSDEKIIIVIKDEGEGFELCDIPDPTDKENLLKESGRGIFIIKNIVDELRFNFTENGTETILEIRR